MVINEVVLGRQVRLQLTTMDIGLLYVPPSIHPHAF